MGKHYISQIEINQVRHLHNLKIELSDIARKNLIITGRNGVGKTTVLEAIGYYLISIEEKKAVLRKERFRSILEKEIDSSDYDDIREHQSAKNDLKYFSPGIELEIHNLNDLESAYSSGKFILAYFTADRALKMDSPKGVEKIKLNRSYKINTKANDIFHKYLVDLKTQQLYAQMENDKEYENALAKWFASIDLKIWR